MFTLVDLMQHVARDVCCLDAQSISFLLFFKSDLDALKRKHSDQNFKYNNSDIDLAYYLFEEQCLNMCINNMLDSSINTCNCHECFTQLSKCFNCENSIFKTITVTNVSSTPAENTFKIVRIESLILILHFIADCCL